MFLEALDYASNNFQKSENEDGFKNSDIDTERSVKYSNKTKYVEFASLVMRWAHSVPTEIGDTKFFPHKSGNFVLLEKTENGYVEIARGTYKDVKYIYEQAYRSTIKGLRDYSENIERRGKADNWDLFNDEE